MLSGGLCRSSLSNLLLSLSRLATRYLQAAAAAAAAALAHRCSPSFYRLDISHFCPSTLHHYPPAASGCLRLPGTSHSYTRCSPVLLAGRDLSDAERGPTRSQGVAGSTEGRDEYLDPFAAPRTDRNLARHLSHTWSSATRTQYLSTSALRNSGAWRAIGRVSGIHDIHAIAHALLTLVTTPGGAANFADTGLVLCGNNAKRNRERRWFSLPRCGVVPETWHMAPRRIRAAWCWTGEDCGCPCPRCRLSAIGDCGAVGAGPPPGAQGPVVSVRAAYVSTYTHPRPPRDSILDTHPEQKSAYFGHAARSGLL